MALDNGSFVSALPFSYSDFLAARFVVLAIGLVPELELELVLLVVVGFAVASVVAAGVAAAVVATVAAVSAFVIASPSPYMPSGWFTLHPIRS